MRTDWALIASLVLTLAPAVAGAAKPDKPDKPRGPTVAEVPLTGWLEVRGPTFTLISNAGKKRTVELSKHLVSFIEVLRATSTIERFEPRVSIRIFVFDNARVYSRFQGMRNTAGEKHSGPRRWHLLVNREAMAAREVLFHEFTHYLADNQGLANPRWFQEGFAELISTVGFREDVAYVGGPPEGRRLTLMHGQLLPLRTVLGARRYPKQASMFYAQSWLLTHYLHTAHSYGEAPQLASMQRYLELLHQNTPWGRAFDEAFEDSIPQLEKKLARHQRRVTKAGAQLPIITLEIGEPDISGLRMVRLSPARAAERLGDAQLATRGATKVAEQFYRTSLDLEPGRPTAMAGLASVFALQERGAAAVALAERAAMKAPDDLDVRLALGLARQHLALDQDPIDEALLEEARDEYRAVMRSHPSLPAGFVELGNSYLEREGDVSEGIAAFEQVGILMPIETPTLSLAKLYLADGRRRQARELLWTVVRWTRGESEKKEARELLEQLDREEAQELFRSDDTTSD